MYQTAGGNDSCATEKGKTFSFMGSYLLNYWLEKLILLDSYKLDVELDPGNKSKILLLPQCCLAYLKNSWKLLETYFQGNSLWKEMSRKTYFKHLKLLNSHKAQVENNVFSTEMFTGDCHNKKVIRLFFLRETEIRFSFCKALSFVWSLLKKWESSFILTSLGSERLRTIKRGAVIH